MKILVCGGREYAEKDFLYEYLSEFHRKRAFTHLIHGDARGADHLAHGWAVQNAVQPVRVPALWDIYGPKAGAIRNARMLSLLDIKTDCVLAFPGGRGTAHMVKIALESRVEVVMVVQIGGRKNDTIRNDYAGG